MAPLVNNRTGVVRYGRDIGGVSAGTSLPTAEAVSSIRRLTGGPEMARTQSTHLSGIPVLISVPHTPQTAL
jgi:hypothetical protein